MRLRTLCLAAALAAFSLPAWGQRCPHGVPVDQMHAALDAAGWELYDALTQPNGDAVVLYCNGDAGQLVTHSPNSELSCIIGSSSVACVRPEPFGTES